LAALAFFVVARQPVAVESFGLIAGLHALAGLGVGAALSCTHGSIGRTANPHRLFALVNVVLGVFAVGFLGGVPQLIAAAGASMFFQVVWITMAVAAVVCALAFPQGVETAAATAQREALSLTRIPRAAWFAVFVVVCLTLNQAMVFSFVERIGAARGFGVERVNGVLIALGLVNLLPGVLAALLQKKLSPVAVGIAGPIGQAVLALTMSSALGFAPYAVAAALYVSMVIFTHTFLFGLLSRLDPSGRAVAATPAMMMIGSCIGPALGGTIVQGLGYPGLGWAACVVAVVAVLCMTQVRRYLPARAEAGAGAAPAHA
jgi:predicted MFS family arabinose efflux permease